jgi:epoxyqueuosine reductase
VADNYHQVPAIPSGHESNDAVSGRSGPSPARGRVARYAWGRGYHGVMRAKLHRLADRLRELIAEPFDRRVCVDTAPVLEREVATLAGIGWIGKNTMVLCRDFGSWFFLGELITTLDLEPGAPVPNRCGTCTRCLEACPTGALTGPYQMDASRCIAYLTIEHRGEIAADLQRRMGDWVFGCDECQVVCPYNRNVPTATESAYRLDDRSPLVPRPVLSDLASLATDAHRSYLTGSAMKRASCDMLQRNAAIALRNQVALQKKTARRERD